MANSNSESNREQANALFSAVWEELKNELGEKSLVFPKEIFWLNGAPGAGKGTQTRFLMNCRNLEAKPIVISDLLTTPEFQKLKDQGIMVGDKEVIGLFFRELLKPAYKEGVIVDGFPRTQVQAECLRTFHDTLVALADAKKISYIPVFHILVLFVNEEISIQRQLYRGEQAKKENTGEELRKTDQDPEAARGRFRTFNDGTLPALESLKEVFPYYFIDASGSIEAVQEEISKAFK